MTRATRGEACLRLPGGRVRGFGVFLFLALLTLPLVFVDVPPATGAPAVQTKGKITIEPGKSVVQKVESPMANSKSSDANVATVITNKRGDLEIVGIKPGAANIKVRLEDGTVLAWDVEVRLAGEEGPTAAPTLTLAQVETPRPTPEATKATAAPTKATPQPTTPPSPAPTATATKATAAPTPEPTKATTPPTPEPTKATTPPTPEATKATAPPTPEATKATAAPTKATAVAPSPSPAPTKSPEIPRLTPAVIVPASPSATPKPTPAEIKPPEPAPTPRPKPEVKGTPKPAPTPKAVVVKPTRTPRLEIRQVTPEPEELRPTVPPTPVEVAALPPLPAPTIGAAPTAPPPPAAMGAMSLPPPGETIRVGAGQTLSFQLPDPSAQLVMKDKEVARYARPAPGELRIVGGREGGTRMELRSKTGETLTYDIEVGAPARPATAVAGTPVVKASPPPPPVRVSPPPAATATPTPSEMVVERIEEAPHLPKGTPVATAEAPKLKPVPAAPVPTSELAMMEEEVPPPPPEIEEEIPPEIEEVPEAPLVMAPRAAVAPGEAPVLRPIPAAPMVAAAPPPLPAPMFSVPPAPAIRPEDIQRAVREGVKEGVREALPPIPPPPPPRSTPAPAPPSLKIIREEETERTAPREMGRAEAMAPVVKKAPEGPVAGGGGEPILDLRSLQGHEVDLLVGKSRVLKLTRSAKRVSLANPEVCDVLLVSPDQVVVNGKAPGTTSLVVWDDQERSSNYDLVVVPPAKTDKQVLLKVKIAEIQRRLLRELGVDIAVLLDSNVVKGGLNIMTRGGGVIPPSVPGLEGSKLLGTDGAVTDPTDILITQPDRNIFAFIHAAEMRGLAKILAEPNLVAVDGQAASFLSGGEFPVTTVGSLPGSALPTVKVDYKEFGVKLSFTPTIVEQELINLKVAPEVSALDFANGVILSDIRLPALTTRKAETVVQMKDGQSLVIAGLIQQSQGRSEDKIPWLGDVPVLGSLFRGDQWKTEETELVILITARIIQPFPSNQGPEEALESLARR